jgi:hypothetical protein
MSRAQDAQERRDLDAAAALDRQTQSAPFPRVLLPGGAGWTAFGTRLAQPSELGDTDVAQFRNRLVPHPGGPRPPPPKAKAARSGALLRALPYRPRVRADIRSW